MAVVFYIGRIIELIAKNAVQSIAPLVALFIAYEGSIADKIIIAAIAAALIILTLSILRYLFFRYRISEDSILIRDGVVKKTQLDIKFDRIQAINTEQNIIYRIFNLLTVKFDTAGSSGQEGSLPAIKPHIAELLQDRIRQRRRSHDAGTDAMQESGEAHHGGKALLKLSNGDMIRIGLSDNRALIFLAFLGPLFERLDETLDSVIDQDTILKAMAIRLGVNEGLSIIAILFVVALVVLALVSVAGAFLRFHRYTLVEDSDVFQSTGGLLTRHVHSVNLHKIQTLVIRQNIMHRLLQRFRLNARQASSRSRAAKRADFAVPICTGDELTQLTSQFLGGESREFDADPRSDRFRPIARQYLRSRTLLYGVLPALVTILALGPVLGWASLVFIAWIPLVALTTRQKYRRYGVQVSADGLALRSGFMGFRVATFLYRKVQRVGVTQTFLQRRKGLATLRFFLASGTIRVPYVDYQQALRLRDYVLYLVESSQKAWH